MKQSNNGKQNFTPSEKRAVVIVASLLSVGAIVVLVLLVILLRQRAGLQSAPTPPALTIIVPTVDCGPPTLVLGAATFQIQNITSAPDGSLVVPPDGSGVAYWVEGTNSNYVFAFSPTADNVALMSALTAGTTAKATWKNCNSTTYDLLAPETVPATIPTLLDQSTSGITMLIQSDPATASFVIRGELAGEQLSTINTPSSGASDIQAEISLIETTASPDGTTIRVGISIQNYGAAAFTLSTTDVMLTAQDGSPLTMVISEPPLPKEIAPAAIEAFYFTFPRPPSPIATLKIFEIEYDIEGY